MYDKQQLIDHLSDFKNETPRLIGLDYDGMVRIYNSAQEAIDEDGFTYDDLYENILNKTSIKDGPCLDYFPLGLTVIDPGENNPIITYHSNGDVFEVYEKADDFIEQYQLNEDLVKQTLTVGSLEKIDGFYFSYLENCYQSYVLIRGNSDQPLYGTDS